MARLGALTLLAPVALAACGETASAPDGPALPYNLGARPALPFPSDEVLEPSPDTPTGARLALGAPGENLGDVDEAIFLLGDDFIETLETLDGWSTIGPAFVSTAEPADPDSLDGRVILLDVEAGVAVPADVQTISGRTDYGRPQAWIEARPFAPLRPATPHALVVLEGVTREADGAAFARPSTFDALQRREDRPEGADPDRWTRALARQDSLRPALTAAGIDPAEVLVADPFTTLSIDEETDRMVEVARARPAPALNLDPDGDGAPDRYLDPRDDPRGNVPRRDYPSVRAMLRVTFDVPTFRADDEARLVVDAQGAQVQREEAVEAIVLVPEGAGPFPVAVYHHGLGGKKESVFDFAEDLCALGVAVIAIDATLHGFRTDRPGNAGVRFLNVVAPALVLDNFRTAQVDQITVVRAIDALAGEDLLGTGEPVLDPSRLLYVGLSLGSIVGAAVIGLEPRFEAAVLFVGGGSLLEFFDRVLSGFEFEGFPTRLFTTVAQTVLDRGDPSNFVRRAADTQVLLIQALEDEVVPAGATVSLARAMGLPKIEPDAAPATGRGWTQFTGRHAMPVRSSEPNYAASRAQAWHFVDTWVRTGTAEIMRP